MGYLDQGRQAHGWFGHGLSHTALDTLDRSERNEVSARTSAAVEFAIDQLATSSRSAQAQLRSSKGVLKVLMPVWASEVGLQANNFRRTFFGRDIDPVDAWHMQLITRAILHADSDLHLKDAGAELATAITTVEPHRWSDLIAAATVSAERQQQAEAVTCANDQDAFGARH